MANRLSSEKSPYLQQHKNNPVDWFPWGEEAFEKAKTLNKPVFLSIGYATCHWCHVMEHESFEDESIAHLMNENFINVKVDREERPDIDSLYMTVCQMLNGHGGWPLTIVMTPEKEPFFAATYIPKEARFNRIGLRQLIPGIIGMWTNEPKKIRKAVEKIREGYVQSLDFNSGDLPDEATTTEAANALLQRFDPEHGGFGAAPKFPSPHNLMFLLREWKHSKDEALLKAVHTTLKKMRLGGIWDHVGSGFHRYSTDQEWLVPHFEKMLYDQALLIMAYTEAWQATKDPLFKKTTTDLIGYVLRELQSPDGAFYSAEDADSEGEEGTYYVWTKDALASILEKDDLDWLCERFNVSDSGNFKDEATGRKTGNNILHLKEELSVSELSRWSDIQKILASNRSRRIRPELDDKVLCDWNGLMIAALAKAGSSLSIDSFIKSAEQAFSFLMDTLWDDTSEVLYHRYKDGERVIEAFADDYTSIIWACLELYEATFSTEYLEKAVQFSHILIRTFMDTDNGGFNHHTNTGDLPFPSQKQIYDGAIPSANSMAMYNLIRLSRLTGDTFWEEQANKTLQFFSSELKKAGSSITMGMMSIQFYANKPSEIVITKGDGSDKLLQYLRDQFLPNSVLIYLSDSDDKLRDLSPFVAKLQHSDGMSKVYVCRDFSCEQPVKSVEELKKIIGDQ